MALHFLSHAQQLAKHLRSEILQGKWSGSMPGILLLEKELGVNRNTIDAALKLLEKEGLLKGQGPGCKRRIVLQANHTTPTLRVAILFHDPPEESEGYVSELYHLLSEAGHTPIFTPKCLSALRMDVRRIVRMVKQIPADAWVVGAGSREILAWFRGTRNSHLLTVRPPRRLSHSSHGAGQGPRLCRGHPPADRARPSTNLGLVSPTAAAAAASKKPTSTSRRVKGRRDQDQ